jgi:hypothetical protein
MQAFQGVLSGKGSAEEPLQYPRPACNGRKQAGQQRQVRIVGNLHMTKLAQECICKAMVIAAVSEE